MITLNHLARAFPENSQETFASDAHEIMQIMVRYFQVGFEADDQTREYVHEVPCPSPKPLQAESPCPNYRSTFWYMLCYKATKLSPSSNQAGSCSSRQKCGAAVSQPVSAEACRSSARKTLTFREAAGRVAGVLGKDFKPYMPLGLSRCHHGQHGSPMLSHSCGPRFDTAVDGFANRECWEEVAISVNRFRPALLPSLLKVLQQQPAQVESVACKGTWLIMGDGVGVTSCKCGSASTPPLPSCLAWSIQGQRGRGVHSCAARRQAPCLHFFVHPQRTSAQLHK